MSYSDLAWTHSSCFAVLSSTSPRDRCHLVLRAVDNLKMLLAPILLHTPVVTHRTQKPHEYLGCEGQPFGCAQGRLFGTQQVVEYQEETRSHEAFTYS